MNDVYQLDHLLTVSYGDRGGLRYEQLDERYEEKLTVGSAYVDEDSILVLVVDPYTTRTHNLEDFESEAWQRDTKELTMWDETSTYRWEFAPGPWTDPVEDSDEIAVMSGF